jgi:hypothetical protein
MGWNGLGSTAELRRAILIAMGLVACSNRAVGPDDAAEDGDGEGGSSEGGSTDGEGGDDEVDDGDDGDDGAELDSGPISTTGPASTTGEPNGCEPGYGYYPVQIEKVGESCPPCDAGSACATAAEQLALADGFCDPRAFEVSCGPELLEDGMCAYIVSVGESGACQDGVGRPFVVDGTMRVAPVQARDDWGCVLRPDLADLDDRVRAELGKEWRDVALAEHASIASFARFVLDLLAVGAPGDLVASAQRALADEIVHARLAFGLASAYLGVDVGPGPLAVDGALPTPTLASIVRAAIVEGCIGETIGAARADHARRTCTDPAVHRVLTVISRDEQRHAELAWRFVAWALGRDPSLHSDVEATFARALADLERNGPLPPVLADDLERRAHGISSARERVRLLRTVVADVLAPCARALLDPNAAAA